MPGQSACAHGHPQPAAAAELDAASGSVTAGATAAAASPAAVAAAPLAPSFDMISQLRASRDAHDAIRPVPPDADADAAAPQRQARLPSQRRPHLHISGFDPRAAGGRHAVRLELRGMPPDAPPRLDIRLESGLLPGRTVRQQVTRGLHGEWRPVFIEFSSRGREHGQYRIDATLHAYDAHDGDETAPLRSWAATLVLLVPRPSASLGEIHRTFLSTHKNVRIHADDASIARLRGLDAGGPMDIDVLARDGAIAQLDFGAGASGGDDGDERGSGGGKIKVALPTLAWDEDLIEIALPAPAPAAGAHPCPASSACLVALDPDAGTPRHVRLFALDACVLGRFEAAASPAGADLLLQHHGEHGPDAGGLTRRLSARHAVIRPGPQGFEIEDVSRYGMLLDGVWPGKHKPVPLRLGMRIELTASIRGVVVLVVSALLEHGVVLHRVDAGGAAECFVLLAPGRRPGHIGATTDAAANAIANTIASTAAHAAAGRPARPAALPRAAHMPLLFHHGGGFWHLDPASGRETALTPASALERLPGFGPRIRFSTAVRPEDRHEAGDRAGAGDERRDEQRDERRGERHLAGAPVQAPDPGSSARHPVPCSGRDNF